jgi:hypothetical protein
VTTDDLVLRHNLQKYLRHEKLAVSPVLVAVVLVPIILPVLIYLTPPETSGTACNHHLHLCWKN